MTYLSGDPEVRRYLERARHERALVVAALLGTAGRGLRRAASGALTALLRLGHALQERRARRRRARAAMRDLAALDDRTLKDIGLSRSDIPFLAESYGATGKPAARTAAGILAGGQALVELEQRPAAAGAAAAAPDPAHVLRTPLTSIRSFSEILRDNPELTAAERAAFLGLVIEESDRLDRAIDDVLAQREAA